MAAGAAIMSVSYLLRIPFSHDVTQVIIGSSLVGLGTALCFAAMPMLIMASVPITETAAANGINSLMRAIGGATSSAVFAAVLASMTVSFGGENVPTRGAFDLMFVLCSVATAVAVGVTWLIPVRVREGQRISDKVVPPGRTSAETVVRGILRIGGEAPRQTAAIVTVTQVDGTPVDWARCDQEGGYSVALPGPGRYVIVGNARGWAPHAQCADLGDGTALEHVSLTQELTIAGTVTNGGVPVSEAMVALHHGAGDFVGSVKDRKS